MNNVLFLDREYLFKHVKSDKFNSIFVALKESGRKSLKSLGQKVVACFEEDYNNLPVSEYVDNYLIYSFDSDRFLNHYKYEKRREILGKEISFWRAILDEYKPTCIVSEVVTIEWMEVLYIEAKKRNIPYYSFLYGFRNSYSYWLDTPFNSEISDKRWDKIIVAEDHKKQAIEYYTGVGEKHEKPFYIQNIRNSNIRTMLAGVRYMYREYIKKSRQNGFVYEYYYDAARIMIERGWRGLTLKHDSLDDINPDKHEYVFYPLHYEPEATISYFAEQYSNQVSDICNIAHAINENQILIVKEHPQQINMLLTSKFQTIKKTCPNVLFIRGDVSSYDIFKRISLIITLTGTGGLEGLICGIPVITLGHVFYNHCRSTNFCNDFKQLKQIIREKSYKNPKKEEVIQFLEEFFAITHKGYPYTPYVNNQDDNYQSLVTIIEHFANNESQYASY